MRKIEKNLKNPVLKLPTKRRVYSIFNIFILTFTQKGLSYIFYLSNQLNALHNDQWMDDNSHLFIQKILKSSQILVYRLFIHHSIFSSCFQASFFFLTYVKSFLTKQKLNKWLAWTQVIGFFVLA